jgi:hypothetical protein
VNASLRSVLSGAALLAALSGAAWFHRHETRRLNHDLAHARARVAFAERASHLYGAGDPDTWRGGTEPALAAWIEENDAIEARFPDLHDPDAVAREIDALEASGRLKPDEIALRREFLETARRFHQRLAKGTWNPLDSLAGPGLRLDVMDVSPVTEDGRPRLRIDAILWGAPRVEASARDDGKRTSRKAELMFSFQSLALDFVASGGKRPFAGGKSGQPRLFIENPERWVPEFPPQAALAVWHVDPFPHESAEVQVLFTGEIRQPSRRIPVTFRSSWPSRDAWRLPEGQPFEGEERIVPAEEEPPRPGR